MRCSIAHTKVFLAAPYNINAHLLRVQRELKLCSANRQRTTDAECADDTVTSYHLIARPCSVANCLKLKANGILCKERWQKIGESVRCYFAKHITANATFVASVQTIFEDFDDVSSKSSFNRALYYNKKAVLSQG